MQSRATIARRIARYIGLRTFRGHWDRKTLLNDCESVAWELEATAPPHVTPGSIAWMAVRRVRIGRQHKESVRSITTSRYDKRSKRPRNLRQIRMELKDLQSRDNPAEVAAFWIDYQAWLARWDKRRRAIAETLAVGGRTGEVAAEFGVTPGRIAQHRREFERDWKAYQGDN
jgi:hypothetical protein